MGAMFPRWSRWPRAEAQYPRHRYPDHSSDLFCFLLRLCHHHRFHRTHHTRLRPSVGTIRIALFQWGWIWGSVKSGRPIRVGVTENLGVITSMVG